MNMLKITRLTFVFAIISIALLAAGCAQSTENVQKVPFNGQTETVTLSLNSNYVYQPQVITVKAGTKVIIQADTEKLTGTMDTLIIDGYNIEKKISPNNNLVEFIADKPGEYDMYCANGMGDGKLIVTAQ